MNSGEISIFLKKAEEYISIAIEKEKKKEYGGAISGAIGRRAEMPVGFEREVLMARLVELYEAHL